MRGACLHGVAHAAGVALTALCVRYYDRRWFEGRNACQNLQFLLFYRGRFNVGGMFNSWITPCCLIAVNAWYSTKTSPAYERQRPRAGCVGRGL